MPRIPRRWKGDERAPSPEEQRTDGAAPSTDPPTAQLTSGDPLAGASAPAASDAAPATGAAAPTPTAEPAEPAAPPEPAEPATAVATPPAEDGQATVAAPALDPQPTAETGATALAPEAGAPEQAPADARPRFRERTRMRRRLRYLRRLRELAFRDLGGLVFDLHRFGRDRTDLVGAKIEALGTIDRELRALQDALDDRREFTDLREVGIAACPRCGTLHDTDANFCPGCGTTLRGTVVRDASPVTVTPADDAPPAPAEQPAPTAS